MYKHFIAILTLRWRLTFCAAFTISESRCVKTKRRQATRKLWLLVSVYLYVARVGIHFMHNERINSNLVTPLHSLAGASANAGAASRKITAYTERART